MRAIILHEQCQSISELEAELRYENIYVTNMLWSDLREDHIDVLEVDVIIVYLYEASFEIQIKAIQLITMCHPSLPIIVLDDVYSFETQKKVISSGADGYLTKPFEYRSLALQFKNIVCKKEALYTSKWLRAFDVWLDLERRAAKREDQTVHLRNKEFALLEYFMLNPGKLLTRGDIFEHVWDRNANYSSNTVDVHINRLRKKIDGPFKDKLIHTIHCVGYIFDKTK